MEHEIKLANGRVATFKADAPTDESKPPIIVLGMRKSGSTLFHKMMIQLSRDSGLPPIDIAGTLFEFDIRANDWMNDPALVPLFRNGYTYVGFRTAYMPLLQAEILDKSKIILLLRDPRDALVSQYFSTKKTHKVPVSSGTDGAAARLLEERKRANEQTVDEYCLMNARSFRNTLAQFVPFVQKPNCKVFYYEDVILKKDKWIRQIAEFCEFEVKGGRIKNIVSKVDAVPEKEDPNKFVRKVIPGDHREKLKPETIEALTLIFEPVCKELGIKLNKQKNTNT